MAFWRPVMGFELRITGSQTQIETTINPQHLVWLLSQASSQVGISPVSPQLLLLLLAWQRPALHAAVNDSWEMYACRLEMYACA